MKKNVYTARYETTTSVAVARYETENEMYLMLEQDNITEENPSVIGITYQEWQDNGDALSILIRTWDFGKPYTFLM